MATRLPLLVFSRRFCSFPSGCGAVSPALQRLSPGKPEESLLIKAIEGAHKDLKMPLGEPLPAEQIQAFVGLI
jgi:hypothetical protein